MRFFHLADLHIGKSLHAFSLAEDQRYILEQVLELAKRHRPDAVLLSGDIYDRQTPSAEAVGVLDRFLTALVALSIPALFIAGNHDSPERLAFAGDILRAQGVYLYAVFDGLPRRVTLSDSLGEVDFHLLPYLRPALARVHYPDSGIATTQDAVDTVLSAAGIDPARRNVLLAHQFVTAGGLDPERSDSETAQVGGLESVDASAFGAFDYVALGHLHRPQQMGRPEVRYAGSPLKYSFSETLHEKSVALVELLEKGHVQVSLLPLTPLRDVRRLSGPMEALLSPDVMGAGNPEDFLHITLTDPTEPLDAMARLRRAYPHVLALTFARERRQNASDAAVTIETPRTPTDFFRDFYVQQHDAPPDGWQIEALENTWEGLEDAP